MTFDTYAAVRDELVPQLIGRGDVPVPACPLWTTKDVVAHLSGLVAEKLSGVAGSLGTDEATARQVADRASMTLDQVLDEWSAGMPAFETLAANDPDFAAALTADLVVHVFDLDEALDLETDAAAAATPSAAQRYVPRLQDRVLERLGIAVDIELTDGTTWPAQTAGESGHVRLRATPHDFLRSVTGRRTRAAVEALDWSSDPSRILDEAWNQYGPFRTA